VLLIIALGGILGYLFVEATVRSVKKFMGF